MKDLSIRVVIKTMGDVPIQHLYEEIEKALNNCPSLRNVDIYHFDIDEELHQKPPGCNSLYKKKEK